MIGLQILAAIALVVGGGVLFTFLADGGWNASSTEKAERLAESAAREAKFREVLAEAMLDDALEAIQSIDPDVLAEVAKAARR